MADKKSLQEALQFLLEEDGYLDRLEAQTLIELIRQDGRVSSEEMDFLCEVILTENLDGEALKQIEEFLLAYQDRV